MNFTIENPQSKSARVVAVVCAFLLTGALFAGYLVVRARRGQEARANVSATQQTPRKNQPIELQVYEDEAYTKASQAIIGGTLRNLSNRELSNLIVEMELIRREDASAETRKVNVEPQLLAIGGQGKYQIIVPAREWSGARLIRIRGGERAEEIAFKSEEGAPRPLSTPNIVRSKPNAPQPRPRRPGDDFYNTPDSAEVIR